MRQVSARDAYIRRTGAHVSPTALMVSKDPKNTPESKSRLICCSHRVEINGLLPRQLDVQQSSPNTNQRVAVPAPNVAFDAI